MAGPPTLESPRLVLRPFALNDAKQTQILAGDRRIADTTKSIPHPYPDGLAESWISSHEGDWDRGTALTYAITKKVDGVLIGAVGLVDMDDTEAELGYWIGVPYWNQGFCTEAVQTLLAYCFSELSIRRIFARHLTRNPASGRVLLNSGLSHLGNTYEEQWKDEGRVKIEHYEVVRPT